MLTQINLVASDIDATAAFYRRLGVVVAVMPGDWPPGSGARHANADADPQGGCQLDFDNEHMARLWGHDGLAPGSAVLGFDLPSREAVDATYDELVAAGYTGRRAPYDAFFGARYAIVDDPDGRSVGLMSPRDPARRYVPES